MFGRLPPTDVSMVIPTHQALTMTIVVSFPESEAERLEPQVDQLIQTHSLTESGQWIGMGFVDIELSGDQAAVLIFVDAVAVLDGVHCTEQP
jgi:hypothetical protein